MQRLLDLLTRVRALGEYRPTRTGQPVRGLFGNEINFNLQDGFPICTTKKVPVDSVIGELVCFMLGKTSAADFRKLKCKVWDDNANKVIGSDGVPNKWIDNPHRAGHDDLGPIYGYQWRKWESIKMIDLVDEHAHVKRSAYLMDGYVDVGSVPLPTGPRIFMRKEIDQLQNMIDGIKADPTGRRHIVTAWNPGVLNEIALPACHTFFQCYVRENEFLDMKMYQRSADLFLGVPFNIASYAALTHVIAHLTGYKPGNLTLTFGDVHIYENHMHAVDTQLARAPGTLPTLEIKALEHLNDISPKHFMLTDYEPQPTIKAVMSL